MKKSLNFILVLLKLSGLRELFADLQNELVIDLQLFVVLLKFLEFSLCALLVRYRVQLKLFYLVAVAEFHEYFCLLVVHSVRLVTKFKSLDLTDDIRSVISDTHKTPANALLIVGVLNPSHKFSTADANLLKVFHLDLFLYQM